MTAICLPGWGNFCAFDLNVLPVGREFDGKFLKNVKSPPHALPPPPAGFKLIGPLSRLATCENLLHSSGYNAPLNFSGRPGRPKFEQLEYFLFCDLGVQDIADALSVSKSTVQRRFREFGVSVSSAMSQQTDDQLDDLVRQIKNEFPNAGYRRVDSQLRCQGIKVPQSRVREAMQRVDPEGVAQRWLALTPRCTYNVPGPLCLWHIDGNHKLIRFDILCTCMY